jgi:maleamate amidohydrolase
MTAQDRTAEVSTPIPTDRKIPAWWHQTLPDDDAAALNRYRRPRGDELALDRSALIVIDVVESFVGPDAPVAAAQDYSRTACGAKAWRALPSISASLAAFRQAGRPIVYTLVDAIQAKAGAATVGSVDPMAPRGDTVHEAVAPGPDDLVLPKTRSSAFFATPLSSHLRRRDVQTVVLVGCTTSGCILASAIDASSLGFDVVVIPEACFDRVDALADAALVTMDAKWASVRPLDDVQAALSPDSGTT